MVTVGARSDNNAWMRGSVSIPRLGFDGSRLGFDGSRLGFDGSRLGFDGSRLRA